MSRRAGSFIAASLACMFAGAAVAEPPRIAEGEPFPNIVLPSLEGNPMSMADFRGKKVLLHVFASW